MKTTNTYGAELLSVMGSDLTVVNAARVSFDKESDWEFTDHDKSLVVPDRKLIDYLASHGHWTPFAHPQISFRVYAPIFVARQLQKHQIGLAWNEVSRRYVDSEPVIFIPDTLRKRAENIKQGSTDEQLEWAWVDGDYRANHYDLVEYTKDAAKDAVVFYNKMLRWGICPEQARMILPQSMMTEWIWTGSLAAFARVCNQRLDSHAQRECGPVARDIAKALEDNFPVSWEALKTYE